MEPRSKKLSFFILLTGLTVYLILAIAGMRYGLPDEGHTLSYNCDELNYIEVLSHIKPEKGQFNPHPFFTHPTGYLWMNASALFLAQKVGWIPTGKDKEFYRENPHLFARFYLVGRTLQILCGLIILVVYWFTFRKVFNENIASLSFLLLAVSPSLVAASHFSQASVPVAMFTMLSLSCLCMGASKGFSDKWLYGASFLTGMAIGTKLSALAFLAPVAYYVFKSKSFGKNSLLSLTFIICGFVFMVPFSILSPRSFYEGFSWHVKANQIPIPDIKQAIIYPFQVAFPHAMGWALFLLCLAGVIFSVVRKKNPVVPLLLVWIFGFYLATVRVGFIATSARVLIAVPAFLLMGGILIDSVTGLKRVGKGIGAIIFFVVFILTARNSLAIIKTRLAYPFQKEISDWIVAHIPRDKTIGLACHIYWWSPDEIYKSSHHPERMQQPYKVIDYDFSVGRVRTEKPDYVFMTEWERTMCAYVNSTATCSEFFDYFEKSGQYKVFKTFPRVVGIGGWVWNRPERLFNFDDDLWVTATTVYKRAPN